MGWIINNKEWLFSGIAIAVPLGIIGWFISTKKNKQNIKSGKDSKNFQAGGNITYNEGRDKKDV